MTPLVLPVDAVPDALRAVPAPVVWLLLDADPLLGWANHPDALTAAERERAARTTHSRTREQFVRGRTVLRAALGAVLGVPPSSVPIVTTADGKPALDPAVGRELHFNVSHTDGVAAFAVAPVPVGVDVECHRDGRDLNGLVERFFAAEEREQFRALPDDLRAGGFLRGWTCKEAVLKGIGCGVRELQNCAVELDPRRPPRVLRTPAGCGAWELSCWAATTAAAAAVAILEPRTLLASGRGKPGRLDSRRPG